MLGAHLISEVISESSRVKLALLDEKVVSEISVAAESILNAMMNGSKLMICGNGGSAADSQHIAAEFVSRFLFDRPAMPAIALTTDTSALTAIGNDYGFEKLFERQVQALGAEGDILIGISTSGNSKNICNAAIAAREKGIRTIGFGGESGQIWHNFDQVIKVPSSDTARIQECHILIGHILCQIVEAETWR